MSGQGRKVGNRLCWKGPLVLSAASGPAAGLQQAKVKMLFPVFLFYVVFCPFLLGLASPFALPGWLRSGASQLASGAGVRLTDLLQTRPTQNPFPL